MAPIPSSTGTIRSSTDATFTAAGTAVTFAFDAGTDSDRFLIVSCSWNDSSGHTVGDAAVTFNGVALTAFGAATNEGNIQKRSYGLIAPATGSNTVSVDPSAGAGDVPAIIEVYCYSGVDQTTPYTDYTAAQGADSAGDLDSLVTVPSAVDDLVWVSHAVHAAGVTGGTVTGFTERLDNIIDSGSADIGAVSGDQAGAASVATEVTWAGGFGISYAAHGISMQPSAASGPTIDTQPTAQTARLHGEDTTTAAFTVEATTSGGTLTYDWELETSVGGGTYANVADGNGATWTGATGTLLTGTFTATTLSGRRVRCNVTDDNGTTTTNAVALTVLTGPVLTVYSGVTNASGVLTTTLTSDDALTTNGEVLCIEATVGSTIIRTTVRPA